MRTVRFSDPAGQPRSGTWTDDGIVTPATTYDPAAVTLLPPAQPTKIVCQAGGYADHRLESGREERPDRPELFLKTPNCVVAPGGTIELPPNRSPIEYEAEIGVVIDEQCRSVDESAAMSYVAGFTCVNDISNRPDQREERNWVRGKAFDASCPIGPVVASPDDVPADATLELRVNGTTEQQSSRDNLLFSIPELIAEISALITLEPGDVVATGTPFGPGELTAGDTVAVEVEGVGVLENTVKRADHDR